MRDSKVSILLGPEFSNERIAKVRQNVDRAEEIGLLVRLSRKIRSIPGKAKK
jgi:hypothetical protein